MCWHLTGISQTIDVKPTQRGASAIGAGDAPLKLLAVAWHDGEPGKGPAGCEQLRYPVMSKDLAQPQWLERGDVISMSPAWHP